MQIRPNMNANLANILKMDKKKKSNLHPFKTAKKKKGCREQNTF